MRNTEITRKVVAELKELCSHFQPEIHLPSDCQVEMAVARGIADLLDDYDRLSDMVHSEYCTRSCVCSDIS